MGETDPGMHFTAGVNQSLYRGDMTVGQPHTDFETHSYVSLVQLTHNTGLIFYQYTGKTVVNTTRRCDSGMGDYFSKKVWGPNVTGQAACTAANESRGIGRTFYWDDGRGTAADSCGDQKCDCCWTGRSIAEPRKNGRNLF